MRSATEYKDERDLKWTPNHELVWYYFEPPEDEKKKPTGGKGEKRYGRSHTHHIDLNHENNAEENLILLTNQEHMSLHHVDLNSLIKDLIDAKIILFDKYTVHYYLNPDPDYLVQYLRKDRWSA
jgi:hypothetical protein